MTDTETRWTADEQRLSRLLHRAVADAEPTGPAPTATRPVAPVVDLGHRRRWSVVAVPAVAACLVAAVVAGVGLATRDRPDPAASPTPTAAPVLQDPAVLVGTWSVSVSGQAEEDSLLLRVGSRSFAVSDGACTLHLSRATHPDGLLVLATDSISIQTYGGNPCAEVVQARSSWLPELGTVAAFEVRDDDHVALLNRDGVQVAALDRRGSPRPSEPTVGIAALPTSWVAPTREQLVGSWYEAGLGTAGRSIWFSEETWAHSQSVPCNSRTEPYALSPTGGFAHVRGPNDRLQGCGARLPAWLPSDVSRVGLDGDELVLLDADGRQVTRLDRGGEPSGSLLDQVQGDWEAIGMQELPTTDGIGLRIEDEWLRHDGNATCNIADDELRLSGDGWVIGSRKAGVGGCEPGGEELLPGTVRRVLLIGDELVVIGLGGDELRRFERADP